MMNTTKRMLIIGVMGFALLGSQRAAAMEGFIRPAGWYVKYANSGYGGRGGGSVAGGVTLGPGNAHELSLEYGQASFGATHEVTSRLGFFDQSSGHITPLLAGYRYSLGGTDAWFRPYVGVSAGLSRISGDYRFDGSGLSYAGTVGAWTSAWGGTVGLAMSFGPNAVINLGYRYLQCGGTTVATHLIAGTGLSPSHDFPEIQAHIAELSLTLHW